MYVPRHFELPEDYARTLLEHPRAGNLVTVHDFGPEATFVPFYLDKERGRLVTHLVRNNPQARTPVTTATPSLRSPEKSTSHSQLMSRPSA